MITLTPSEILTEYTKSLQDPAYFIQSYLETFDKSSEGFVPFKLYPRQLEFIGNLAKYRFNISVKPRQAGVSTCTAAYLATKIATADPDNPEAILIIANKQDLAYEFLGKIRDFLQQTPRYFWGEEFYGNKKNESKTIFLTDAKGEIKLPNGCRVKAVATSKDALRGFTPTHLVMDEAAYIDNGVEVFGAALTSLGSGGKATLISTPGGLDLLYYNTYEKAKSGENDFHVTEFRWFEDLRYNKKLQWLKKDEKTIDEVEFTFDSYERMLKAGYKASSPWYEDMCRGMNNDPKMIAQELDVSFLGSGGSVISVEDIEFHEKNNVREPLYKEGLENEFWTWEEPIVGHKYLLSGDVARGDGEDSSTIVILDTETMIEVMEYRGKCPPDVFAQYVEKYGIKYNALVVIDISGGMGVSTVLKLIEFGYDNLYYEQKNAKILSEKTKKLQSFSKDNRTPGFTMTNIRTLVLSNLEEKIRTNAVKVRSIRMVGEMKTFVFRNGKADHQSGSHDDLLQALAMALYILEHSFKELKKMEEQSKAILNAWGGNTTTPDPNQSQQKPNTQPQLPRNYNDPRAQYSWLFSKRR